MDGGGSEDCARSPEAGAQGQRATPATPPLDARYAPRAAAGMPLEECTAQSAVSRVRDRSGNTFWRTIICAKKIGADSPFFLGAYSCPKKCAPLEHLNCLVS